jgi:hypothetical protein
MLRAAAVFLVALTATAAADDDVDPPCACDLTPAACDAGCACDSECEIDWSVDECSLPDAGCDPMAVEPTDATLEASDMTSPDDEQPDWATGTVTCPDGADLVDGRCVPNGESPDVSGGCNAAQGAGLVIGVLAVILILRRRRFGLAILAACSVDAAGWDDAVDQGPSGDDRYLDVYAADVGDDGLQLLLADQPLADGARQPTAIFSLERAPTGSPIYLAGAQLSTSTGDELLGWAHTGPGDGTAELVELTGPDGTFAYETQGDTIDGLVAQGYAITNRLGYVWPPGYGEALPADDDDGTTALTTCKPSIHSATHAALELLYSSPGADESERFLVGCPGEVVIGEKRESGPVGRMRLDANHVRGGRTGFVLDRHGDKLRALLLRANGVERTAAYLRHKLAIGYDYIVIDEVTTASDYRDGQTFNRRLRALMQRMPIRTIIPYISIDLVQEAYGFEAMQNRKLLLRTFKLRARAMALEIYMHTGEVIAGRAPATFRLAADRLALSVHGLERTGGINLRAISSPATSMHSSLAQYRYLDDPRHDLDAITRQVNAIRHASRRTRQQHGLGYYFVGKSDMTPVSHYTYDQLIKRMRTQALRFR